MGSQIIVLLFVAVFINGHQAQVQLVNGGLTLTLDTSDQTIGFQLLLDGKDKLSGNLGEGLNDVVISEECDGASDCLLEGPTTSLNITSVGSGFLISWQTTEISNTWLQDCINMKRDEVHWYGGPEKWNDEWPRETVVSDQLPYMPHKSDNAAVSERYWLHSAGTYIFVDDRVPLYLDQNSIRDDTICFIAKVQDPYLGRSRILLEYVIAAFEDSKQAQLHAVNNYLGKPTGHLNERIVRKPIWTTWAKYKTSIDDATVMSFAIDIAEHGFSGQLEIDDYWEACYGSLTFGNQFVDINNTVQALKDMDFTVSIWVHPFVNDDCKDFVDEGQQNGYFAQSADGNEHTSWWEGGDAHQIDFTKEKARNWFADRLKLLQDKHGIDSFKFDAGECDFAPPSAVLNTDIELSPAALTHDYVETCATFGGLIEVRSAWRTQNLPILVRMLDKDSRWGLDNGLHAVITTLLGFNIVGYSLVLPDMIGGNGYGALPSAELLARWTQANTFMPTMQFSILPWDISSDEFDGMAIIRKYVDLHTEYADEILAVMDTNIQTGAPVNPPIWWVDPTNPDALGCNDEYLLGENILVAPVIVEGATSRNVILPAGTWKDGNSDQIFEGPQIIENYPAPIDVLPYFIRQ